MSDSAEKMREAIARIIDPMFWRRQLTTAAAILAMQAERRGVKS